MPADYVAVRNSCYEKKRKANNGRLSKKDMQACKKMAAIWYFKKHGKPVQHSGANYMLLNGEDLILKDAIKPLSVLDYNILIQMSPEDMEKYEVAATGGLARATTFLVKDLIIGDKLDDVGISTAEINEAKEYLTSRVIDQDKEDKKSGSDEVIDDFLPQNDASKQNDLMYISFKLVHAGGNANHDFFQEDELARAQFSPVLKPLNWQHGEPNFGTIYLSKLVPASENEPTYIKCAAVIYKYKYPDYAKEIVNRYNNDKLSFSMEVWFTEFECSVCHSKYDFSDYEICKHLVERYNQGSSAYRILHNLTFAGAGVVDSPADELANSISIASVIKSMDNDEPIVNNSEPAESADDNLSNTREEDDIMPINEVIKSYTDEDIQRIVDEKVGPLQAKIDEISSTLTEITDARDKAVAEIEKIGLDLKNKSDEFEKLQAELAKVSEEYAAFKKAIDDEKKLSTRLAELNELDVHIPEDEAEAAKFVDQIKSVDDTAFDLLKKTLTFKSVKKDTGKESIVIPADTKASKNSDVENQNTDIPIGANASAGTSSRLSDILNTIHVSMRGNDK